MKIASGPKTAPFKALRLVFFLLLCVTVALIIWFLIQTISSFKHAAEWNWDTEQSQTYEQRGIVRDLRLVSVIAAIAVAFGFTNIIFGFVGVVTLSLFPLVIFAILDSLTLILSGIVIAYEDDPNLSIGWLVLNVVRLLIVVMIIREVKIHSDEIIKRRVMEKEVTEH